MASESMVVAPVSAETWPALRELFGERGDPATCWCQWFKLSGSEYRAAGREEVEERLHRQVEGLPSPGVLAWLGDEPVGWSAVEPYTAYPGLARSPITKRQGDDSLDGLWAVTCFVVRRDHRGQGVARALLAGAVAHAAEQGAAVVEGYPVDPEVRPSLSAAERYHGTVSLFTSAGFAVIRRPSATRAIMRLELAR